MLILTFSVILLCSSFLFFETSGQNNKNNAHPLSNLPNPSEDVVTAAYIPQYPDQKIPIGETVTILCHFVNDGTSFVNITSIVASLNSPFDYNFYIQNFSMKSFGLVIKSGEEITLDYQFQVHPSLEPVDFTLSAVVFYESESEVYSSTFFNQTIELYHPVSDFDIVIIGQVLFGILSAIIVILLSYIVCFPDRPIPLAFLFKSKKNKEVVEEINDNNLEKRKNRKSNKTKKL